MTDARLDHAWTGPKAARALGVSLTGGLERALRTLAVWLRRWRTRRQLAGLDARMRADLAMRWEDARAESRKPFWRS